MFKIYFASNEYYLNDGCDYYGPFHSIADAEYGLNHLSHQRKIGLAEAAQYLIGLRFIKNTFKN